MSRKLPPQFELKIERLNNNGEGVGFFDGREVNVFGSFPGEIILAKPTKRKKKAWKAELLDILKPSKKRRDKKEDHYLSCSPWQTIDEKSQLDFKKNLVLGAFKNMFPKIIQPKIIESKKKFHYRNKIEFSFTETNGELGLAFHKRYRYGEYSNLDSCSLAEKKINKVAEIVLDNLREEGLRGQQLKNLLIRYSKKEDKVLVVLYVVDRNIGLFDIPSSDISGWQIIYSDPLSPFIKTTEILFSSGDSYLTEDIHGVNLKYYYDSFFQINPKSFESILKYLEKNIKNNKVLVDLYSGVGTIGLSLHKKFKEIHLVEFDKKASEISLENASQNNINNVRVYGGETEKQNLAEFLQNNDTLIVDPPRSGMHPKAISQILDIAPKDFIYISCNPFTQLNDMQEISKVYNICDWRLFDMYPQTPHLESVLILTRK